jgi:hypothetical protein
MRTPRAKRNDMQRSAIECALKSRDKVIVAERETCGAATALPAVQSSLRKNNDPRVHRLFYEMKGRSHAPTYVACDPREIDVPSPISARIWIKMGLIEE